MGEGGYPHIETYSFSHKFLTKIHIERFHKKFQQNQIINPDFRILEGAEISKFKHFLHQLLNQILTLCLELLRT